jgi:hypothetical protein
VKAARIRAKTQKDARIEYLIVFSYLCSRCVDLLTALRKIFPSIVSSKYLLHGDKRFAMQNEEIFGNHLKELHLRWVSRAALECTLTRLFCNAKVAALRPTARIEFSGSGSKIQFAFVSNGRHLDQTVIRIIMVHRCGRN